MQFKKSWSNIQITFNVTYKFYDWEYNLEGIDVLNKVVDWLNN